MAPACLHHPAKRHLDLRLNKVKLCLDGVTTIILFSAIVTNVIEYLVCNYIWLQKLTVESLI